MYPQYYHLRTRINLLSIQIKFARNQTCGELVCGKVILCELSYAT